MIEPMTFRPARRRSAGNGEVSPTRCLLPLSLTLLLSACVVQPTLSVLPQHKSCRTVQPSASIAVSWVGPGDPRDRESLDAWCDTVGPVVAETRPRLPAPPADVVAVVSWNTHAGGGRIGDFVRAFRAGDLTGGAPVPHLVLLLQEVVRRGPEVPYDILPSFDLPSVIGGTPGRASSVPEVARTLGMNLLYVPSMRNGPGDEDRGNAILSTLRLDDPAAIELPFERQRRVAVSATVELRARDGSEKRLRVATAHFDTSMALLRGGPSEARARQARALIAAMASRPDAMVLGGDFNTWWGEDEPAVKELRRALPDAKPLPPREATWRGPLGSESRLDYLFARLAGRQIQVRRVRERFGSDHHPLIALIDAATLPLRAVQTAALRAPA
jgi:endonuclease/exonuclease/phosphatase family metal-dependent hydrolase